MLIWFAYKKYFRKTITLRFGQFLTEKLKKCITNIVYHKLTKSMYLALAGSFFGRIPDIRLIYNAGYPVPAGYLANIRYPANYRISGVKSAGYHVTG